MKKILYAFFAILLMSSFNLPKVNVTNPKLDIKLVKNSSEEWEFDIHNKTKFYIDDFWVAEVKGDHVKWHHGHFTGKQHFIAPDETMHLKVYDVKEGDYYMYTIDKHDHHNHLYKLHMDHDVDVDDSEEEEEEEMVEVFGKKVGEEFEPEDDDDEHGDH
jgi:hypothetical protein